MTHPAFHLGFPYRLRDGAEVQVSFAVHVEQMMELILFTTKGERVNLPEFGCSINQLVFQDIDSALVPATLFLVKSELQRFITPYATIQDIVVLNSGPRLDIEVRYTLRDEQAVRAARYSLGLRS